MTKSDAIVVGGGLAGLCCALRLQQAGLRPLVLEAGDRAGGRVKTDEVEGFRLDRGFQVLLTAYPEARHVLDYPALELKRFYPGALVRRRGRFWRVADPFRRPFDGLMSLAAPVGTLGDKLKVARLRQRVRRGTVDELLREPQTTTREALERHGFSSGMIESFFRPFMGGVLLDRELDTSSRMFEFTFRMFSVGDTAVPAAGMEAIPRQIAARLEEGTVRTGALVVAIDGRTVRLAGGEALEAPRIVVATEGPEAMRLIGRDDRPASRTVTCLYFAAEQAPHQEPILILDGDGRGPVNNLCVPSRVAPSYAPAGAELVSATVLGLPLVSDAALEAAVREQLAAWFGLQVQRWRHLRTYRIPHALPALTPERLEPPQRPVVVREGLYVCGDHLDTASIQGAMVSGRRAAEAVIADAKAERAA